MRSAQEIFRPYFCLIGQSSRRALSRFALSGQLLSGAKRHANEQRPVVAEVGRPPVLRIPHQAVQVLDHGVEVEALEFLGVVEGRAHRIGQGGVLVENVKVQLVRPPVAVRPAGRVHDRALARAFVVRLGVHVSLLSRPATLKTAQPGPRLE
jgi:hypothetical protein